MQVNLSNKNETSTKKVHRLVATAFIGPPPTTSAHVNHRDFAKDNNFFKNLEWCSGADNLRHAVSAGRFDGTVRPRRGKKLNVAKVREIRSAIQAGQTWRATAARFGICTKTLGMILNGKIWARA
jgi:hypothetical protein